MLTARTVGLRPIEPDDLPLITKTVNDPRVRQSVVGWGWPLPEFQQLSWLESLSESSATRRLAVVDMSTGLAIGITGLWDIDWHNRSAMSAIKLDPDTSPRGVGTETIMLATAWAFYEVGLRRLWATILATNGASLNMYIRKCGWIVEGVDREAIFRNGEYLDLVRVAMLESDFRDHPSQQMFRDHVFPPAHQPPQALPGTIDDAKARLSATTQALRKS